MVDIIGIAAEVVALRGVDVEELRADNDELRRQNAELEAKASHRNSSRTQTSLYGSDIIWYVEPCRTRYSRWFSLFPTSSGFDLCQHSAPKKPARKQL